MTIPGTGVVRDAATEQNLQNLRNRFPLGGQDVANKVIGGAKLADDVVGAWHTVASGRAGIVNATGGAGVVYYMDTVGAAGAMSAAIALATQFPPRVVYIDPADYTIAGRTAKMRLRATCAVNATAPTVNLSPRLDVVTTSAGAAGVITIAGLTLISAASFVTPAANSLNQASSAAFDVPAAGFYTLGVSLSAAVAANSACAVSAQLQVHWI